MSDEMEWPVAVEYTTRHVVWTYGKTPEEAAKRLRSWPYEATYTENAIEHGVLVERAFGSDFEALHDSGSGIGEDHGPWAADRAQYYGAQPEQVAS